MLKKEHLLSAFMIPLIILGLTVPLSCSSPTSSPTPSPGGTSIGGGGGAVVLSDSIVTGKIVAIRSLTSGYPAEIDIEVQKSEDVGSLPNPTKDKVGQVITCKTDLDISSFKAEQIVTANIKYVGDVPRPGITLYIYNIKPA